jgi:hypothetical protein
MIFIGSILSFQVSSPLVVLEIFSYLFLNTTIVTKFHFYNGPNLLKTEKKIIRFLFCIFTVIAGGLCDVLARKKSSHGIVAVTLCPASFI